MAYDVHIVHCCREFGKKILTEAIRDLRNRPRASKEYQIAFNWIADRDNPSRLPFGELCGLLNYDPQVIREGLLRVPEIRGKLTEHERTRLLGYSVGDN